MATYPQLVIADGAVAYWRLGELSGTAAADSTGNGRTGTIAGGVTLGQPGVVRTDPNTSMRFDGSTASLLVADHASLNFGTASFTVEAWVYNEAGTGIKDYVAKGGDTSATAGWMLRRSGGGSVNLQMGVSDGVTQVVEVVNNAAPSGQWRHMVGVVDRGAQLLRLYANGAHIGTDLTIAAVGSVSNAVSLGIGSANGVSVGQLGRIDEVAIYPTALTAATIAAHYAAATSGGFGGVPWWVVSEEGEDMAQSYNQSAVVTPSNTVDLLRVTDALWVGGAGDLAIVQGTTALTLVAVPAGSWLPLKVKRVNATGTTATNIVAMNAV